MDVGRLTLLAVQEVGEVGVKIYASDLLPEAVATTRLTLLRFADVPAMFLRKFTSCRRETSSNQCRGSRFDLIIFNAPWVVSRARNRAEIAIHDEKQQTAPTLLQRDLPNYLNPRGRVLIGYADASGAKSIARLEAMIDATNLTDLEPI